MTLLHRLSRQTKRQTARKTVQHWHYLMLQPNNSDRAERTTDLSLFFFSTDLRPQSPRKTQSQFNIFRNFICPTKSHSHVTFFFCFCPPNTPTKKLEILAFALEMSCFHQSTLNLLSIQTHFLQLSITIAIISEQSSYIHGEFTLQNTTGFHCTFCIIINFHKQT